jgi:RNA recognition motif-containing protein
MGVKLFVGGLSFTTSSEGLRDAFARHGMVQSAIVMTDRETQRSRGFGFVEMATSEDADRAIAGLNGAMLDGRTIRVDKATPRGTPPPPRPNRPSGPGGPRPGGPRPWSPSGPSGGTGGGPGGGGNRFQTTFPPPAADRSGGGRGAGPGRKRTGEGDRERRGPKRSKLPGERRAGDKGRRSEEGYRW